MFATLLPEEIVASKKFKRRWQTKSLLFLVLISFVDIVLFGMRPEIESNTSTRIFVSLFAALFLIVEAGLILSRKWALHILLVTLIFSLIVFIFTAITININFIIGILNGILFIYLIRVCDKYDFYDFKN